MGALTLLLRRTGWTREALSFASKLSEVLGDDLVAVYVAPSPDSAVDGVNALVVVRDPGRVERRVVEVASEFGVSPAVAAEGDPEARSLGEAFRRVF